MKGTVVLSENILEIGGLLISFVLIILVVQLVFSNQRQVSYELIYQSVARDIAVGIDRAGASAGSVLIEHEIPKGLQFNLKVDYKSISITYDGKSVKNYFITQTHTNPQSFANPEKLCLVKTKNDGRVVLKEGTCKCNTKDGKCDPECAIENVCDPACYTNKADDVCNPLCVKNNDLICDPDCYRNETDEVFDTDCVAKDRNPDGVCDPDSNNIADGICDLDCFDIYKNGVTGVCDPDCKEMANIKDGACYTGCVNQTIESSSEKKASTKLILLKDGICDPDCRGKNNICDPDCTSDPDCKDQCAKLDESCESLNCCPNSGAVCCPTTKVCSLDCCGNGKCEGRDQWEPGNKIRWETSYTCSDCGSANRPTCSAGGSFTSSACFYDTTNQPDCNLHKPYWTPNVIEVCSEAAKEFLDRRNWDIKEVAKTVMSNTPEGWAFDASRYFTIQNQNDECGTAVPNKCFVQPASKTIEANEKYTDTADQCCTIFSQTCCPSVTAENVGSKCRGVGFCGDHATAMLSILRTLGVPAKDVYSTFFAPSAGTRHAFVVYYCDPNLPENLKLNECNGNWNEWLIVDATHHEIIPLKNSMECNALCIWFNDVDIYAKSEGKTGTETVDGKTITIGRPFPSSTGCSIGSCCGMDGFCSQLNAKCKM